MYQQGFCSAYCCAKHCDPRLRYMVDYPSPYCGALPNFNKHMFPKDKHDLGGPIPCRKFKKRKRCKSILHALGSAFMLKASSVMPQGADSCPVSMVDPSCKKTLDCEKRKVGGCERVQETCTEFMEIVQEAVQDTVQQCAKATMAQMLEQMTCKIEDLVCQMKELKEVVMNVGTKNDLRFKCICEFLFANLKPAKDAAAKKTTASNTESRNEQINDIRQRAKSSPSVCCCKHCLAKAKLEDLNVKRTRSATSQASSGGMWPQRQTRSEEKKCCFKSRSSYSMQSNNVDIEDQYMTTNISSYAPSIHAAQCQCIICCKSRSRENKRSSKMYCCKKSAQSRPSRKLGGMNQRCTARDYKPSPKRTQILSEHCQRLDEVSKATSMDTRMSFPHIIIDDPLSPPEPFKDKESSETDETAANNALSDKTLCTSGNYAEYRVRSDTPDNNPMRLHQETYVNY